MKDLIKQYLDHGISRRKLMSGLSALGISTVAAKAMAQSLAPFASPAKAAAAPGGAVREMTGTGGALYVQQLKAAGVQYIFFNPSTGDSPIFDALVDEPGITLIKGIQEGAVGGHGRRLCAPLGQAGDRHRRQCRSDQRDDADGQHLQGPHPDAGHGGRVRAGAARPRVRRRTTTFKNTRCRPSPSGAGWRRPRAAFPRPRAARSNSPPRRRPARSSSPSRTTSCAPRRPPPSWTNRCSTSR